MTESQDVSYSASCPPGDKSRSLARTGTPLHRALYLGHLSIAQKLLQAGASTDALDHQARTPLDLVSAELVLCGQRHTATSFSSAAKGLMLYAWGSGANYQVRVALLDRVSPV